MTDRDRVKELLDFLSIPYGYDEADLTIRVGGPIEMVYRDKRLIAQELPEKGNPQAVVGYDGFEASFCFDCNDEFMHISITE